MTIVRIPAFLTIPGRFTLCPAQERYVPDEYRDWGVEIKGFDCLTSSVCAQGALTMKRTRALPSVGCEADAVVPEVAEQTYLSAQEGAVNSGFADGTINCGPACITDDHAQRWSVALADPRPGQRTRARVEFGLVNEPFGAVTVFLEHWDGPFCNGQVLPGCGGKDESFATDAAVDSSALSGDWGVESTVYTAVAGGWEVAERCSRVTRSGEEEAMREVNVCLPRGVSVGIMTQEDGGKCVTAGWVVEEGVRIVSRRRYDGDGSVAWISRDIERIRG